VRKDIEDYLFEKGSEYDIIHYAGHAKCKDGNSYIALPSTNGDIQKITSETILTSKRNHSLVTISACESGLGQFRYGDGLESLSRSYLASGVSSVLYSLWTVNDQSTSLLMQNFYENISQGFTKDIALQKAKLDYLKTSSPEIKHPYYWAGFVISGANDPIIFNDSNKYLWLLILVPLILLFINFIDRKS